jgi:hypothetical protein
MIRAWVCAALLAVPSPSAAQPCDDAEARSLFERGLERASGRDLTAARDAYTRSLELCPRVPTAYNLAVVLRLIGTPLASRAILDALVEGRYGRIPRDQERVISQLRDEVRGEIGELRIVAVGADAVVLVIDGREIGALTEGTVRPVEVDPGRRLVRATAPDGRTLELVRDVEPGQSVEVRLDLPLSASNGRLVVTAPDGNAALEIVGIALGHGRLVRHLPPDEYTVRLLPDGDSESVEVVAGETIRVDFGSSSVLESPWFWLIGGTAIAAAGAVVLAVALAGTSVEDPIVDPVWGRVELQLP